MLLLLWAFTNGGQGSLISLQGHQRKATVLGVRNWVGWCSCIVPHGWVANVWTTPTHPLGLRAVSMVEHYFSSLSLFQWSRLFFRNSRGSMGHPYLKRKPHPLDPSIPRRKKPGRCWSAGRSTEPGQPVRATVNGMQAIGACFCFFLLGGGGSSQL